MNWSLVSWKFPCPAAVDSPSLWYPMGINFLLVFASWVPKFQWQRKGSFWNLGSSEMEGDLWLSIILSLGEGENNWKHEPFTGKNKTSPVFNPNILFCSTCNYFHPMKKYFNKENDSSLPWANKIRNHVSDIFLMLCWNFVYLYCSNTEHINLGLMIKFQCLLG